MTKDIRCILGYHDPEIKFNWMMKGTPYPTIPTIREVGNPKGTHYAASYLEAQVVCKRCGHHIRGQWSSVPPEVPLDALVKWNTMPDYIEAIEAAIRDIVRNYGREVGTPPGRERIGDKADILGLRLTDLADHLAVELGFAGDPNITYLQCLSMISYAWMIFIIEAKSKAAARYDASSLVWMKRLVDSYPSTFKQIHDEAVKLGDEYPVDNPKWAAAVAEWEAKQKHD
jgi:hypothetical protein